MSDTISPQELDEMRKKGDNFILLDVRRAEHFAEDPSIIPGAVRKLPESVESWAAELPAGTPIVLYCVRGGSVSQAVTPALQKLGRDAKYIAGGIDAWKANGGDVEPADPLVEKSDRRDTLRKR
ncbi:MAG TPA: thiosulfate sulfurtransferase GlpE [Candidatus Eremiobacteraceae bacterium]